MRVRADALLRPRHVLFVLCATLRTLATCDCRSATAERVPPAARNADGGYGGSDTNYRYSFVLPDTFKQDTVSKTEKAVNGTDVLYVNPASRDGA
jgi:hypothetical protein